MCIDEARKTAESDELKGELNIEFSNLRQRKINLKTLRTKQDLNAINSVNKFFQMKRAKATEKVSVQKRFGRTKKNLTNIKNIITIKMESLLLLMIGKIRITLQYPKNINHMQLLKHTKRRVTIHKSTVLYIIPMR